MEEFLKLLSKKAQEQGGPKMNRHMEAKAAMAKELSDVLSGDLADGIKGMKKVTVASDSDEGLEEGLEKAKEVLESKEDMEDESEESENSEDSEDSEEMDAESEMEDVESEISKLEEQIKALKSKKK